MNLIITGILILLINIPFGYWRAGCRRRYLQWFLAIHIPVPLIIGLTFLFDIGFAWYTYAVKVAIFLLGHYIGGIIRNKKASTKTKVSAT